MERRHDGDARGSDGPAAATRPRVAERRASCRANDVGRHAKPAPPRPEMPEQARQVAQVFRLDGNYIQM